MKVSIVTAVMNSEATLADCLRSVREQTHPAIEHIVVDGASTDGSLALIRAGIRTGGIVISEPDDGIYDAMNKGIAAATGDIVCTLNADDVYSTPETISRVVRRFEESKADVVFGDIVYVSATSPDRIIRHWKAKAYKAGQYRYGIIPPHPAFFARKSLFDRYGSFDTRLDIAADYELILRYLERCGATSSYLPEIVVRMRVGGESNRSLTNIIKANIEAYHARAWNGLSNNPIVFFAKPLGKLVQYFYALQSRGRTDSAKGASLSKLGVMPHDSKENPDKG